MWVKEWTTLENTRTLKLEGHDLTCGWHAFAWYGRDNTQVF